MPRVYKRAEGSRTYESYSDGTLVEAIQKIQTGKMILRKASVIYGIPSGTLSNKMNNKHTKSTGHPLTFTEKEEEAFVSHI